MIHRTWQGEKCCVQWFEKVFQSQYLLERSFEIEETPDIHGSAVGEPIHCPLLHSLQVRQRNEFFTITQNMTTPPHYIPYGEPFTKREENTQVTRQLLANDLAFLILLLSIVPWRVVCSLSKKFSTCKILRWGINIGAANKLLTTSLIFHWLQRNLSIWSPNKWAVNTNSLVDLQ